MIAFGSNSADALALGIDSAGVLSSDAPSLCPLIRRALALISRALALIKHGRFDQTPLLACIDQTHPI